MNRLKWICKEFGWLGRRVLHVITGDYHVNRETYAGCGMIPDEEANRLIYDGLVGDKPFAVGRTGFGEIGNLCCAQNEIYFYSKVHYYVKPSYVGNVRLYRENNGLQRYRSILNEAMSSVDCIGTYLEMFMCDAILEMVQNINSIPIFNMDILQTLGIERDHWTKALANKRVLIVSPFYKEIEEQYQKRDLLWPDGRIPEFDLECDPSIWIRDNGGFFRSFEVLSDRVLSRDFDIALLSCGSLGLPMSAAIKKSGRKAVQMGSMLHVLFGLKGKRWDNMGIYNEYWVRPGDDTKPTYFKDIDGATYW